MRSRILLGFIAIVSLSACQKPQPMAYDAEKSPVSAGSGVSFSSKLNQAKFKYKLPKGWQEVAPGPMRVASFKAPLSNGRTVEVAVTTLSGPAGGLLANVNRWRGQVGLGAIASDQLGTQIKLISDGPNRISFVEILNPTSQQMVLAGIIESESDTWFFKSMGPVADLKSIQTPLIELIKSVGLR